MLLPHLSPTLLEPLPFELESLPFRGEGLPLQAQSLTRHVDAFPSPFQCTALRDVDQLDDRWQGGWDRGKLDWPHGDRARPWPSSKVWRKDLLEDLGLAPPGDAHDVALAKRGREVFVIGQDAQLRRAAAPRPPATLALYHAAPRSHLADHHGAR